MLHNESPEAFSLQDRFSRFEVHVKKTFKIGDYVSWNSEAGRVRGTIIKKLNRNTKFKGYTRHATPENPQYMIQSNKTDHIAVHKATALRRLKPRSVKKS